MVSKVTRIRLALKRSHPVDIRLLEHLADNPDDQQDLLRTYARAGFALMQGGVSSGVATLLAADEEEICRALALVLSNPSMRTKALSREIRRHFFEDEHGVIRPSRRVEREEPRSPHSEEPAPIQPRLGAGEGRVTKPAVRPAEAQRPLREQSEGVGEGSSRGAAESAELEGEVVVASPEPAALPEADLESGGGFVDPMKALSLVLDG